ncbi:MAG: molybdate ABC transporter substrate-binding protein [Lachnospiraceae bacterium]|nr:molybdate ABC transporter substrate-binding protein [Lachnospiraceae bacterium]
MRSIKKLILSMMAVMALLLCACASGSDSKETKKKEATTALGNGTESDSTQAQGNKDEGEIIILAAASLKDVCAEIETEYKKTHDVKLTFSFGSSGALQTQIEEGAPADIFFSASTKQMKALYDAGKMEESTVRSLLENRIVLIVPAASTADITSFEDVNTDKVKMIGLGDPESVPAGQYAAEVFTDLGILDAVNKKANFGTDVRTVLSWVETGNVDCGVVYATDACTTDKVRIAAEAPAGSCRQVIYPAGVVKDAKNPEAAKSFMDYLASEEAFRIFAKYGFASTSEKFNSNNK